MLASAWASPAQTHTHAEIPLSDQMKACLISCIIPQESCLTSANDSNYLELENNTDCWEWRTICCSGTFRLQIWPLIKTPSTFSAYHLDMEMASLKAESPILTHRAMSVSQWTQHFNPGLAAGKLCHPSGLSSMAARPLIDRLPVQPEICCL